MTPAKHELGPDCVEHGERLASIETKMDLLCASVESMKEAVMGNGHPGIKTRLALVEGHLSTITKAAWAVAAVILGLVGDLVRRLITGQV